MAPPTRARRSGSSRAATAPTSRVTRSRSQTPALQEEQEVSRLHAPLDVLSEDEEEVEQVMVASPQPDKLGESESPLLTKKERGWVAAMLVLLVLVVGSSVLVGRLQGEGQERAILVLAYTLAPLRALVEAARLVTAREGLAPAREVDYDLLAARILDSSRFQEMVDKMSGEKVARLGRVMEDRLGEERGLREREVEEQRGEQSREQVKLMGEMGRVKEHLSLEVKEARAEMKLREAANEDKEQGLVTEHSIKALENQITDLQARLSVLQEAAVASGDTSAVSMELAGLQARLAELEAAGKEGAAAVAKCCGGGSVQKVVSEAVEKLLAKEDSVWRRKVAEEFPARKEVEEMVGRVERRVADTVNEAVSSLAKETKNIKMNHITEELARLKSSLVREIEANFSMASAPATTQTSSISSAQEVARIVREALTKYDADKTGLFDFALESAGGSIVTTKCTEPYQATSAVMSVWGLPFWWDANSPRTILQPGSAPGQCWAFRGSYGTVVVKLSSPIHISAITIEHISPLLSPDGHIYSAPQTLSLGGLPGQGDAVTSLLNFTYSAAGEPVQTFWLGEEARVGRFEMVELTVHKNHGHPDYTCLYRVRVHGAVWQGGSGLH